MVEEEDDALDDEDRAVRYIRDRATRFKMRVIVPCLVLGTAVAFGCAGLAGLEGGGKAAVVAAFSAPFIASIFLCSTLVRVTLPRRVAHWLIEAADRYGVSRRSLVDLVRNTVLSVPSLDLADWAQAAYNARSSRMGLLSTGGPGAESSDLSGRRPTRRRKR